MTSPQPWLLNDDNGDSFPGAVPPPPRAGRLDGREDRLVRMRAAYTEKVNAAVQAGREALAHELAEQTYVAEVSGCDPVDLPVQRSARRFAALHGVLPRRRPTRYSSTSGHSA